VRGRNKKNTNVKREGGEKKKIDFRRSRYVFLGFSNDKEMCFTWERKKNEKDGIGRSRGWGEGGGFSGPAAWSVRRYRGFVRSRFRCWWSLRHQKKLTWDGQFDGRGAGTTTQRKHVGPGEWAAPMLGRLIYRSDMDYDGELRLKTGKKLFTRTLLTSGGRGEGGGKKKNTTGITKLVERRPGRGDQPIGKSIANGGPYRSDDERDGRE